MFPLHQIAHVGVIVSRCLKLFGCEIIFEVFQPVLKTSVNVTDGRTDGQTDRRHYNLITALCIASRGKNHIKGKGMGQKCSHARLGFRRTIKNPAVARVSCK